MLRLTARLALALSAPLALVACDDEADFVADDAGDVALRCSPNCGSGTYNNTSFAGEWSLANINTAFGVQTTNWSVGGESNTSLSQAGVSHLGTWRNASKVWVTPEGELKMEYRTCGAVFACVTTTLGGAQLEGARLYFKHYVGGVHTDTFRITVFDYAAQTIHGKPAHVYTLTTNASYDTPELAKGEHQVCVPNTAGDASPRAVFIPGMQLDPEQLVITAQTNGAIIACESGADGKLVLGYGYHQTDLGAANSWTAGLKMITGDICGTGHAYTTPGRLISVKDSMGINDWSGALVIREGDYDHTGMICRGQKFRGPNGESLSQMLLKAPCLQEMFFCDETLTPPAVKSISFGVKVEGLPTH